MQRHSRIGGAASHRSSFNKFVDKIYWAGRLALKVLKGTFLSCCRKKLQVECFEGSPQFVKLHLNVFKRSMVFTALHGMQTRSSDENSVRPSVCVSVKRVHCDKTEERSVQIFIPYERPLSLVFWEEEWLVGQPLYLKFWVNRPQLEGNRRFWTDIRS